MSELKTAHTFEPSRSTVSLGYTRNMGNFESLRIDISISDSTRVEETTPQAVERIYRLTEKLLVEKIAEIESSVEATKPVAKKSAGK